MTTAELNRDVKRLAKKSIQYSKDYGKFDNAYNTRVEIEIKKELDRLYYCDKDFKYMSKKSVLILFRLNLSYRSITLHNFGTYIELKDLI